MWDCVCICKSIYKFVYVYVYVGVCIYKCIIYICILCDYLVRKEENEDNEDYDEGPLYNPYISYIYFY